MVIRVKFGEQRVGPCPAIGHVQRQRCAGHRERHQPRRWHIPEQLQNGQERGLARPVGCAEQRSDGLLSARHRHHALKLPEAARAIGAIPATDAVQWIEERLEWHARIAHRLPVGEAIEPVEHTKAGPVEQRDRWRERQEGQHTFRRQPACGRVIAVVGTKEHAAPESRTRGQRIQPGHGVGMAPVRRGGQIEEA
jgi:hypothetical protein